MSGEESARDRTPGRHGILIPFAALVIGAVAMGASPLFVRLAETGPAASAFWRVFLALPALALWAAIEARGDRGRRAPPIRLDRAVILAGLLFAGDLAFWHLAILNTTIANATFLATMAPVWVVLGSGWLIGEAIGRRVPIGLALCLAGAAALLGSSWSFAPGRLEGDIYGLVTSVFFGGYFLAIRAARRRAGPGRVTFLSSLVTAPVLLVLALALSPSLFPDSASGWAALAALALVSHVGGQGLLAYALGHLPAAFSSLVIFLEAVAAALFAWLVFAEAVSPAQAAGGALILMGIFLARPRRDGTRAH